MDKRIFEEEKQNLVDTIDLLNVKIEENVTFQDNLEKTFSESNAEYFKEMKDVDLNDLSDNNVVSLVQMQSRLEDLQKDGETLKIEAETYKKMLLKPYFARIDIKSTDMTDKEKYYIGIHSLTDKDNNYSIIDWRSPIASLYYDYENGDAFIVTDKTKLPCKLLNKRQFKIENGILEYYFDSSVKIDDDFLQETLARSSSNQMKSIVQTIQKEQNNIIRSNEYGTMVVQGVAGSGKTAIALHRIAYLLYKLKGKVTKDNIMLLSPNNAFSTYISTVLPDLAEEDVPKFQLDNIMRMALKKHLIVEEKYKQVERLIEHPEDIEEYKVKTSYKFLSLLLDYCKERYVDGFKCDDFEILGVKISGDKITHLFHNKYKDKEVFVRIKWICENIFDIHFYREKRPDKVNAIKQQIFLNIYKNIKNKNAPKVYMDFLSQHGMRLKLNSNMVKNEDVYPIFIIRSFIYGADKFPKIKHIVIDEMQDYSPVQFYVINYLFNCPKTILGDYSQSLSPKDVKANYKYIKDILEEDISYVTINKSYRPTREIADLYNYIGNVQDALVVDRPGNKPELISVSSSASADKELVRLIKEAKKTDYKSIAVVTKTNREAATLYERLSKKIAGLNLIDDNADGYNNETCIISAFNSKGLEFDYVIVYNVSDSEYHSDIDNNLLYISCSRALHELKLLSIGAPNKKIEKYFKKD